MLSSSVLEPLHDALHRKDNVADWQYQGDVQFAFGIRVVGLPLSAKVAPQDLSYIGAEGEQPSAEIRRQQATASWLSGGRVIVEESID